MRTGPAVGGRARPSYIAALKNTPNGEGSAADDQQPHAPRDHAAAAAATSIHAAVRADQKAADVKAVMLQLLHTARASRTHR